MKNEGFAPKSDDDSDVFNQRRASADQLLQFFGQFFQSSAINPFLKANPFASPFMADPFSQILQNTWGTVPFCGAASPPNMMSSFFEGLKAYQQFPFARPKAQEPKVIWQQGTTVLRDYGGDKPDGRAVFVIPSLINRFDILDLSPTHSFLRFLNQQGLRPFVLDWGEPGDEEKGFSISDYVVQRILPAVDFISPRVAGGRLQVLGYCMGGLLSLALTLMKPETVTKLALMAVPWNFFAAGKSGMGFSPEHFIQIAEQAEPYFAQNTCFPADALRLFFTSFQPLQVMEKFKRFASLDPSSAEAEIFVLSEDWLNNGVPLSAPVARECLKQWYGENRPGKINWRVNDILIDPRLISCPTYFVVPGKDRLVPPESTKPLVRLIRGSIVNEPMLGHIGLLSSNAAPQEVWGLLAKWLLEA